MSRPRRESDGISPASSMTSLSGSFSPRDSPGPMSPGGASLGDRKKGGGGIQMQIQQLQGRVECFNCCRKGVKAVTGRTLTSCNCFLNLIYVWMKSVKVVVVWHLWIFTITWCYDNFVSWFFDVLLLVLGPLHFHKWILLYVQWMSSWLTSILLCCNGSSVCLPMWNLKREPVILVW